MPDLKRMKKICILSYFIQFLRCYVIKTNGSAITYKSILIHIISTVYYIIIFHYNIILVVRAEPKLPFASRQRREEVEAGAPLRIEPNAVDLEAIAELVAR